MTSLHGGRVLVYHNTAPAGPVKARGRFHNVSPDVLRRQVAWLKRHYDVIDLDSWFAAEDIAGKVAITFDDGYDSVFSEALPVLLELGLPSRVFLCGRMLEGGVLWRDKIRFLVASERIGDFLDFAAATDVLAGVPIAADPFRATLSPRINGARLDSALDRFFDDRGLTPALEPYRTLFRHADGLIDDPLISYGNHTYNHYVMSSLTLREQIEEIDRMETLLRRLDTKRSRIFGLPFGSGEDANDETLRACAEAGFAGLLYCRDVGRSQPWRHESGPIRIGERKPMPNSHAAFVLRSSMFGSLLLNAARPFRSAEGMVIGFREGGR